MTVCGLTISIPKTKFLAAGSGVVQSDLDPVMVLLLQYHLFAILALLLELNARISQTASTFGACRRSVFGDAMLQSA